MSSRSGEPARKKSKANATGPQSFYYARVTNSIEAGLPNDARLLVHASLCVPGTLAEDPNGPNHHLQAYNFCKGEQLQPTVLSDATVLHLAEPSQPPTLEMAPPAAVAAAEAVQNRLTVQRLCPHLSEQDQDVLISRIPLMSDYRANVVRSLYDRMEATSLADPIVRYVFDLPSPAPAPAQHVLEAQERTPGPKLAEVESAVEPLIKMVARCSASYYPSPKIFAPYFAVIQSSGVGKSTCLYATALRYQHSAFLLLNQSNAQQLLPKAAGMKLADRDCANRSATELLRLISNACGCSDPDRAGNAMSEAVSYAVTICTESAGTKASKEGKQNLIASPMLLILDEASVLCKMLGYSKTDDHSNVQRRRTAFEIFRKALADYCQNHLERVDERIVMIVADTTSTVSNFVPPALEAASHLRFSPHPNLFPVVCLPFYFDVLADQGAEMHFMDRKRLLQYGRPLWKNSGACNLRFVLSKLRGKDRDISGGRRKDAQELACLACRIPLRVLESSLCSDLVGNSTALCMFVSDDRAAICCSYGSEPIVAEAAASSTFSMHALQKAFRRRQVDTGAVGELMAQKILLDAFDRCVRAVCANRQEYLEKAKENPILLLNVLEELCQPEEINRLKAQLEKQKLSGMCVFFNHFIEIAVSLSPKIALQALKRCCGIMLKPGSKGADLCLPLFLPGDRQPALAGWLWVQVKLRQKLSDVEAVCEKLRPFNVLSDQWPTMSQQQRELPFIGLVLSLHPEVSLPSLAAPKPETINALYTAEELHQRVEHCAREQESNFTFQAPEEDHRPALTAEALLELFGDTEEHPALLQRLLSGQLGKPSKCQLWKSLPRSGRASEQILALQRPHTICAAMMLVKADYTDLSAAYTKADADILRDILSAAKVAKRSPFAWRDVMQDSTAAIAAQADLLNHAEN